VQEEEEVVETPQAQKPVSSGVKLKKIKKLGKK
jgi:hypothetical protein